MKKLKYISHYPQPLQQQVQALIDANQVVHELAHFKEKEHNKAFYKLCEHMFSDYHQAEFDLRLYLTEIDLEGKINAWNQ